MEMFLVTASPPTPNGDLHVGHLSGPFLAADVFNRFQRMRGRRSHFVTGSDDYQTYVLTAARRQGRDPQELAGSCADQIEATLAAAEIEVDRFVRAVGNRSYAELVCRLFRGLAERKLIVAKRCPALWCGSCERLLLEGFVRGWCPSCGQEAPGHLCEMCGRFNDPIALIQPTCTFCGCEPQTAEREGLFFPLEPHRRRLEDHWAERTSWRPHLKALCEAILAGPLPDYPVSYPGRWGIPVPLAGFEGQVVNVWLEIYPGHVHAARTIPELCDGARLGSVTLVQFLGHDNSFFNAVLHSAAALALGGDWPLPQHLIANEFYFLEGEKFSTSRNHTFGGREALDLVGPDCLRYHLARTNPERWQADFSLAELRETERNELGGLWSRAIEDLFRLAGGIPPSEGPAEDLWARALIDWTAADLERSYGTEEFSLRRASITLHEFVIAAGSHAARTLRSGPGPVPTSPAGDAATLLRALALFSAPLMPGFAQEQWTKLGLPGRVCTQRWAGALPALR
jgi:methionyl-tRNA synthetase